MSIPGMHRLFLCVALLVVTTTEVCRAAWPDDPTVNVPVCTAPRSQSNPVAVSDGAGGVIIIWVDCRDCSSVSNAVLYAQRVDSTGVPLWAPDGVALHGPPEVVGALSELVALPDGAGGAFVAWRARVVEGAGTGDDIYAQRVSSDGARLWPDTGVPVCSDVSLQGSPRMIEDGAGGIIVAWADGRGPVHAQRLTAAGDPLWILNGVPIIDQNATFIIAADGSGGALLSYRFFDSMLGETDVYVQRLDAAGTRLWGVDGVAICEAPNWQTAAGILPDGTGGAVFAWADSRDIDQDIYAQRVTAAGVPLWASDGVPVCTEDDSQFGANLVTDQAGGILILWIDYRPGHGGQSIYAQRLDGAGTPLWTSDGLPIRDTNGLSVGDLEVIEDGAGGAIATFYEHMGAQTYDYHAQRISNTGARLWGAAGMAVCTAPEAQILSSLAPGVAGEAILAWQDFRNPATNDWDIYAQRVPLAGVVGIAGPPAVGSLSVSWLHPVAPNPLRHDTVVRFELPGPASVSLAIFTAAGRRVRELHGGPLPAGVHGRRWDGRDASGRRVPHGVYFVRLDAGGTSSSQRLVKLR